jgi:hypothetical protein
MYSSLLGTVGMKNGSGGKKKMSTTSYLAERHGIDTRTMYVTVETASLPAIVLMFYILGTLHTIYHSWLGSLSIGGNIYKVI